MIKAIDSESVCTFSPIGTTIPGPNGGWDTTENIRTFYWFDRSYNLLEMYDAHGTLLQLYAHIASPVQIVEGELHYTDYELDVVCHSGQVPFIDDEHEFEQAVAKYNLTPEFRAACYQTVDEVIELIHEWVPQGLSYTR